MKESLNEMSKRMFLKKRKSLNNIKIRKGSVIA